MQCCGSGMFIPDPGSWFLPIPAPGSKKSYKREGWKSFCHITFFCSHKFHKKKIELLKKKIWAKFQRIVELFTQKVFTELSKIWVWDPSSGIRKNLFRIPYPGVIKKAPHPGSGSATLFKCKTLLLLNLEQCYGSALLQPQYSYLMVSIPLTLTFFPVRGTISSGTFTVHNISRYGI